MYQVKKQLLISHFTPRLAGNNNGAKSYSDRSTCCRPAGTLTLASNFASCKSEGRVGKLDVACDRPAHLPTTDPDDPGPSVLAPSARPCITQITPRVRSTISFAVFTASTSSESWGRSGVVSLHLDPVIMMCSEVDIEDARAPVSAPPTTVRQSAPVVFAPSRVL